MRRLRTFEIKTWRIICRTICDNEKRTRRRKFNKELHEKIGNDVSVVSFVKRQKDLVIGTRDAMKRGR